MEAWPQQTADDPPAAKPVVPSVSSLALPISLSGQLVTVLANMVFTARQEVCA
jgi:hypothetical protein